MPIFESRKNKLIFKKVGILNATLQEGVRLSLIQIGRENVRRLQRLIRNPPKTGRMYGHHQASAPGEPPANETGELLQSVKYEVDGSFKMEFGDSVIYGKYLEEGTHMNLAPRPHLIRTVQEKSKDNFVTLRTRVFKTLTK